MSPERSGKIRDFIDRASFDQIAQNAKQRRALFMRRNPKIIVMLTGSIGLVWIIGLLLTPTFSITNSVENAVAKIENQSETRVSNATAQIEKLDTLLEDVDAIAPNTAHEIAQLIHQPLYDCNKVSCSSALQQRNYIARSKLEAVLAQKALPDEAKAETKPGEIEKIVELLK